MTNTHPVKLGLATLISLLPLNILRVAAYRLVFHYRIENARVGWGTLIAVKQADLNGCRIGIFNRFTGPMKVRIGHGTLIHDANVFYANIPVRSNYPAPTERILEIGQGLHIGSHHFFDLSGSIFIGDGTRVAGRHSQFWTHGAGQGIQDICVGKQCFLASAILIGAGIELGDNVIVGLGSVVTQSFKQNNLMVGGHPARILRENYDWQSQQFIRQNKAENNATL